MLEIPLPSVTCSESIGNHGRFLAEPLEPGFGTTLGNAYAARSLARCLVQQ